MGWYTLNHDYRISQPKHGALVISLDFELYWGMHGVTERKDFLPFAQGVRHAIPSILSLFKKFGIHGTWAVVGFILFDKKKDLLDSVPDEKPTYKNPKFSTYHEFRILENKPIEHALYFGADLARQICETPHQELGTHTFSHYYTLDKSQTAGQFVSDLDSAIRILKTFGSQPRSIVFPRNQINLEYLPFCIEKGIFTFRGNPMCHWYDPERSNFKSTIPRLIRLFDTYFNLTGHHTFLPILSRKDFPCNIPASRFLRPCKKKFGLSDRVKVRRICKSMDYAVETNTVFHLWWHPHNFGKYTEENLIMLERILMHFNRLHRAHGFESLNMIEAAAAYCHEHFV